MTLVALKDLIVLKYLKKQDPWDCELNENSVNGFLQHAASIECNKIAVTIESVLISLSNNASPIRIVEVIVTSNVK